MASSRLAMLCLASSGQAKPLFGAFVRFLLWHGIALDGSIQVFEAPHFRVFGNFVLEPL